MGMEQGELHRLLPPKRTEAKGVAKGLKSLQKNQDTTTKIQKNMTKQFNETQLKLQMVNKYYELMDQQQKRMKKLWEVPEADTVQKLCVQIMRQYLDKIKMEDELRERMPVGQGSVFLDADTDIDLLGFEVEEVGLDDSEDDR